MGIVRLTRIRAILFTACVTAMAGGALVSPNCALADSESAIKPTQFGAGGLYHAAGTQDLAYSPNGKILASLGTDGVTVLWDRNSKMLHRLGEVRGEAKAPRKDTLSRIYFSGNSQVIAVVDASELKGVWDIASGKELQAPDRAKLGHVTALAIADDGSQIAVGDSDKGIRLFSLASGKEL